MGCQKVSVHAYFYMPVNLKFLEKIEKVPLYGGKS